MKLSSFRKFKKDSIRRNEMQKPQQIIFRMICILVMSLLLVSCLTLQTSPRIEYVDLASDLSFPEVPEVKANRASELTDAEYNALVDYMIKAEKVFDIIAAREVVLETINSKADSKSDYVNPRIPFEVSE